LRSAFKLSCVWYYREVAKRIGGEEMRRYIDKLDMAIKIYQAETDNFWLCGSIKISINEQIEILKKLYLNSLMLSREPLIS
jgi:beta-lactamase class D